MPSTYSNLKFELIASGEQAGTWGTTTNVNIGTAVEEAITGSADITFSSADVTLTLDNTNSSQAARNLRLNLVGTSGGARQLILGAGCQINKLYLVQNNLQHAVTIKNPTGNGVAVPAESIQLVFNNGTDVIDASPQGGGVVGVTASAPLASSGGATPNISVTGTLPIANGGTGQTGTPTNGQLLIGNGTGFTRATLTAGSNVTITNSAGGITIAASPQGGVVGVTASAPLASSGGATPNISVTGTLAVANGGTGQTGTPSNGQLLIGNGTGFTRAALTAGSGVTVTNSAGGITIAATGTSGGGDIPSGSSMLFVQTTAPTGWTKSTTHNNKALRIVSGTAGSGGTVAFTTAFSSKAVSGTIANTTAAGTVGNTTLVGSQIPIHNHNMSTGYSDPGGGTDPNRSVKNSTAGVVLGPRSTSTFGGSGAHNHTFSGTAHNHTFSGTAINMAVQYVDVIICTKS